MVAEGYYNGFRQRYLLTDDVPVEYYCPVSFPTASRHKFTQCRLTAGLIIECVAWPMQAIFTGGLNGQTHLRRVEFR